MKTKHVMAVVILLLVGSFSMEVMAQENLAALVKKCESNEAVDIEIVKRRDRDTKKLTRVLTEIKIKSDPALVNEFLAAFKKDEPNAYQVTESKKNGRIVPEYYRFDDGTSYSFDDRGNGNASITMDERFNNEPKVQK